MRSRYIRSLLGQFRFGEMVPYIEWPGAQVHHILDIIEFSPSHPATTVSMARNGIAPVEIVRFTISIFNKRFSRSYLYCEEQNIFIVRNKIYYVYQNKLFIRLKQDILFTLPIKYFLSSSTYEIFSKVFYNGGADFGTDFGACEWISPIVGSSEPWSNSFGPGLCRISSQRRAAQSKLQTGLSLRFFTA